MKRKHLLIYIYLFLLFYTASACAQKSQKPILVKLPFAFSQINRTPMENTPALFNSRLLLVANYRPSGGSKVDEKNSYLYIDDLRTGEEGKAVSYTTKGKVQAYVQFKQSVPEGFERINLWPVQLFDAIAIPKPLSKK